MRLRLLLFILMLGGTNITLAQTYESAISPQQDITGYGETFTFSFTSLPAGGWGDGQLIVYYSGDFGDGSEYNDVVDEDANNIGAAGPYSSGNDCDGLDSTIITFDASLIDTWMGDNQVDFFISPTMNVDPGNCSELFLMCKLVYNYCAFGTPQELASISLTEDTFCNTDSPMTLTGSPAGGTWSGAGVSGNQFNPSALSPGQTVQITYTATDGIGCVTSSTESVRIKTAPSAADTYACPGGTAELSVNSGGTFVWFEDQALTQVIDTAIMITTPNLNTTTTYYVAGLYTTFSFEVDSIGVTDSMVVDHDMNAGDDRGGIAITPNYVYVVGDNNTVRADALDLGNQMSLPLRDGLFSDLSTGNLYTLWNTDEDDNPGYNNPDITINAIRTMDDALNLMAEISPLDTEIPAGYGSIVLSGYGFVGIISGNDGHAYVIDLDDYAVTDLGLVTNQDNYGSENWADWGVLEFDGIDFSALYSSNNGQIVRHNLSTNVLENVSAFTGSVSDMASFTISPWNNRWYFHYEGYGDQFGGNSETMGYANAGSSAVLIESNELGCYSDVVVTVNVIDMGGDTTACEYNVPVMLFAGNGYESYTWNGVNNNYNVFAAMEAGEYVVEAVDEHNCTIIDTIVVTLDECLDVQEQELFNQVALFPNPTFENASLKLVSTMNTSALCMIIDLSGKVLSSSNVEMIVGENTIALNTTELASGTYLVRLSDNTGRSSVVRLVKN